MSTYTITRAFHTHTDRTPRVLEIAEAFGLGLSDSTFVIYDNLEVRINQGDVVYITGQSGSGKSLLLRDLSTRMRDEGLRVGDIENVTLDPDLPVIEQLGRNTGHASELLAKAGISDAWIYIRKPSELSDGQRYRLRLAKLLDQECDVWIADEFGAVLDRITAKCVAWNCQKLSRRENVTLMVATTHTDLEEELAPNLLIHKRFREKVDVRTNSASETIDTSEATE